MNATIRKWGNSLALRLPLAVARQIGVEEGDAVKLEFDASGLRVKPARPSYRRGDLVRKMTAKNLHTETDWGKSKGREIW